MHKRVRDKDPLNDLETARMAYIYIDYNRRLVIEASLFKRVPNFNSMQSALLIDDSSSELKLKSEPKILRNMG